MGYPYHELVEALLDIGTEQPSGDKVADQVLADRAAEAALMAEELKRQLREAIANCEQHISNRMKLN